MKTKICGLALVVMGLCGNAWAQSADFDPRAWKKEIAGTPTQVLVLGSPHLSGFGENFKSAMLSSVLDRLANFNPDIITIEALSGEQCDTLKRYAATYPEVFSGYCWDSIAAEKATGLTVPMALAEIKTTLQAWPSAPTAAQRRHLAALFLAANDRFSAQVQWQKLNPNERTSADGIDAALLKVLQRENAKPNENFDIGVKLAVRLGHERVFATDDHSADSIQDLAGPQLGEALQKMWAAINFPEATEAQKRVKELSNDIDVLALYRFHNNYKNLHAFIQADFGDALKSPSPALFGRQYVAWWETRNLRMVANIRSAFANKPGARVLTIVGASHKPYFDAYLDMMHEVRLVDAQHILK
ncbi:MAG: hypothetical protein K2P84_14165 [Undibacterium sp.]|nr:hypothetical protein [Undibacterium sp.]